MHCVLGVCFRTHLQKESYNFWLALTHSSLNGHTHSNMNTYVGVNFCKKVHTCWSCRTQGNSESLFVSSKCYSIVDHTWLHSHLLFTFYENKIVIYEQRYHQTTNLTAESVAQKSLNLVTCSLARIDLFPAHIWREGEIDWKEFEGEFDCQQCPGINSPSPFICSSRKNSYVNCHTQLYC